jgi:hypothetical protein
MAEQKLYSKPVTLLIATVLCSGVLLGWLGWNTYMAQQRADVQNRRNVRIEELRGTIVHIDEVLTMSARMAAVTGDLSWETRYRQYEPGLDAVIKEAIALAPESYSGQAATKTDSANIVLVQMENQAFDLVRQGQVDEAWDLFLATYTLARNRSMHRGCNIFQIS